MSERAFPDWQNRATPRPFAELQGIGLETAPESCPVCEAPHYTTIVRIFSVRAKYHSQASLHASECAARGVPCARRASCAHRTPTPNQSLVLISHPAMFLITNRSRRVQNTFVPVLTSFGLSIAVGLYDLFETLEPQLNLPPPVGIGSPLICACFPAQPSAAPAPNCLQQSARTSRRTVSARAFRKRDNSTLVHPGGLAASSLAALGATVLSFLLVFRTNKSYGRFDDAHKLWGALKARCRGLIRLVRGRNLLLKFRSVPYAAEGASSVACGLPCMRNCLEKHAARPVLISSLRCAPPAVRRPLPP